MMRYISTGDGSDLRDYVIKCGIIPPLIALIKSDTQVGMLVVVQFLMMANAI